ncbi:MAG: potassium channel family protein, partial [Muribaculaceae bacterium]|nr:potassium channel family protein [Muribaculaceae bacterium]
DNIKNGFKAKKEELIITLSIFCIGILVSSILLYFAENQAQPELFSSIPKCFYFSVITFTSLGYGDIVPITTAGKIISSLTAILGIGLHGLFIGVIGSAFMQAFKKET